MRWAALIEWAYPMGLQRYAVIVLDMANISLTLCEYKAWRPFWLVFAVLEKSKQSSKWCNSDPSGLVFACLKAGWVGLGWVLAVREIAATLLDYATLSDYDVKTFHQKTYARWCCVSWWFLLWSSPSLSPLAAWPERWGPVYECIAPSRCEILMTVWFRCLV